MKRQKDWGIRSSNTTPKLGSWTHSWSNEQQITLNGLTEVKLYYNNQMASQKKIVDGNLGDMVDRNVIANNGYELYLNIY